MRTVAIWFAGLLASGIFGWLVDEKFLSTASFPDGGPGMIGGMLAFACVRLWLATPSKEPDPGLKSYRSSPERAAQTQGRQPAAGLLRNGR
jgi:dipeptide/tripeptide permease